MPRPVATVTAELGGLTASDFDYSNPSACGLERLDALCDELRELNKPEDSVSSILGVLERLGECDLGSPGSLVHTLERWPGRYEGGLAESVRRKPVYLTVWMVNRILNADPPDRRMWLELLSGAATNPMASEGARAEALRFMKYQRGRRV